MQGHGHGAVSDLPLSSLALFCSPGPGRILAERTHLARGGDGMF